MSRDREAIAADLMRGEWRLTNRRGKSFRTGVRRGIRSVLLGEELLYPGAYSSAQVKCFYEGASSGSRIGREYLERLDDAKGRVRAAGSRVPADDAPDDEWWEASIALTYALYHTKNG